jgi:hypothetical protein
MNLLVMVLIVMQLVNPLYSYQFFDLIIYFLVPSSKVVCYKCGLKMFKELAYQFRVQMKPDDIYPVIMRNRDNCYYGKRCRTQYTKPMHAEKLNHACDQTKF